jgi:hypothetical protein
LRLNHACLVGYDWNVSKGTPEQPLNEIIADFRREYAADSARLHKLLQKRFDDFKHTHLRLRFEVFFLPFPSVQEFRTAFNEALE